VACLFGKDPLTPQPDTLPLPYNNENPHPSMRITVLLLTFFLAIYAFLWLVTQDLYPDREIDVALSDDDNVGSNEPVGNDAGGNRAPSTETLTPNSIGSSSTGKPAPQLPIGLFPPLHQPTVRRKNVLCLGPCVSTTKLWMIR
jgi:nitrogen fixation-related uncharacterized protein